MSKQETTNPAAHAAASESQEQRWVKYGANVALNVVLVIAIGCIAVYAAQRFNRRSDVTSNAIFGLKPQTVKIIEKLDKPVEIVALYYKLQTDDANERQDFRTPVLDLLEEYKRTSKNITVEAIDPVNEPTMYDGWLKKLKDKYGGNYKEYDNVLKDAPKALAGVKKLASAEMERMQKMVKEMKGLTVKEEVADALNDTYQTVAGFPAILDQILNAIGEQSKEIEKTKGRIRDYKGEMSMVEGLMNQFSRQLGAVKKQLDDLAKDAKTPAPILNYVKEGGPNLEQIKKQVDELVGKMKSLGELKLDEIRRKLARSEDEKDPPQAIVVMGPDDIKIIEFKDVWKSGENMGMPDVSGQPKLRFAGEQRITAAILTLTQKAATKVCFVRSGGPPVTTPSGGRGLSYVQMAERLKSYNFEVVEKDLSGMWAMQAMQQRMPAPPEPSDEDIKNAIWIVLPAAPFNMMMGMGPTPSIAPKVQEHVKNGGSALILLAPSSDNMSGALKDFGIEAKTDYMAVHEPIADGTAPPDDIVERAKRVPFIFVLNQLGDQPLVKPLRSLDTVLLEAVPVKTETVKDVTTTPIIPLPTDKSIWAKKDFQAMDRNPRVRFDPENDLAGPLYLGAAAEKSGGGRVVAIGAGYFARDGLVDFPDVKLLERQKIQVARFPGNGELFANSVFWLAKKDELMALSPAAMEVSRIAPMTAGVLNFWRIGVLLILLPALVVGAGLMVYFSRRD